jgi:hypothetical protein
MREYETDKHPFDEVYNKQRVPKTMWNRLRWLPCMPTAAASFYSLYLFHKIGGNTVWMGGGALVFNVLWLVVRLYRTWMVYKWVKEPVEAKPAE